MGIQFINIEVVRLDAITDADVVDDLEEQLFQKSSDVVEDILRDDIINNKDVVFIIRAEREEEQRTGNCWLFPPGSEGRSRERSYHNKEVERHHPPNNSIFQRRKTLGIKKPATPGHLFVPWGSHFYAPGSPFHAPGSGASFCALGSTFCANT